MASACQFNKDARFVGDIDAADIEETAGLIARPPGAELGVCKFRHAVETLCSRFPVYTAATVKRWR